MKTLFLTLMAVAAFTTLQAAQPQPNAASCCITACCDLGCCDLGCCETGVCSCDPGCCTDCECCAD